MPPPSLVVKCVEDRSSHLSDVAWLCFAKLKTEAAFSQLGFVSSLKGVSVFGHLSKMQTIFASVRLHGEGSVVLLVS